MPTTRIEGTTVDGSEYVPASYANFYIANRIVLVPMYDPRYDEQALELIQKYFKERKVVGVDCRDLVWGQGSIHCITQQLYGI
jgi:agmatine deiminase